MSECVPTLTLTVYLLLPYDVCLDPDSFKVGDMHGWGRHHWADGTEYTGTWKDNEICGHGVYRCLSVCWCVCACMFVCCVFVCVLRVDVV
jgi:MORN repeat